MCACWQADIVSCHPTLFLAVVRKMRGAGAIEWPDEDDTGHALYKLREYAELDADGVPRGRLPMLKRIAAHYGIPEAAAKDTAKEVVLRVLNLGCASAWCRDMGIACPRGEQADLRDLGEAARKVRTAFFAMLDAEAPGALEALRGRVQTLMRDKHGRKVAHAAAVGAPPPPPLSSAACERTMFSHCIFELEDAVLDCIDGELRRLGWTVASLIYDGVRPFYNTGRPTHRRSHIASFWRRSGARRAPRGARPDERAAFGGGRRQA